MDPIEILNSENFDELPFNDQLDVINNIVDKYWDVFTPEIKDNFYYFIEKLTKKINENK